jgi:hypothetical protein
MIMAKARTFEHCSDLRVTIGPSDENRTGGNWAISLFVWSGPRAMDGCQAKTLAYATALRKDYDVAWPEKPQ